jgi:hypothetical protein
MKMNKNAVLVLLILMIGCHDVQKRSIVVRFLDSNSTYHIEKVDFDQFQKAFESFYKNKIGRFFVSSSIFREHIQKNEPILIQIPELDSNTFIRAGQYLIDKSKVICVFDNSDGGNYVLLKDVDPTSFRIFHNVFGGKDSTHVFFQSSLLLGVSPKNVRVYSSMQNCSNCDGYFVDGNITYVGSRRITDSSNCVPKQYQFVE